jgi:UPF0755 protein
MKKIALLFLVLIAAGAATAGWWFYTGVDRPYKGYEAPEVFIEIPQGAGSVAIAKRLADAGVVHDVNSFRLALWMTGEGRRLQAGEYRFDHPVSARDVAGKIARGEVFVRPITFPEGLTMKQMAALYESKGFGPASDFLEAAKNASLVAAIDPEARDLEGYLFPDTYKLPRRSTAAQLVGRMAQSFMKTLTPELIDAAEARQMTVRQFVTLASIVEKETGNKDERPLVAAVYSNRLRIGMPLQCDPTVIYALDRAGRYTGNLTRDDLQYDSHYNTYRYPGLPPGPIASPGRASLEATAHPASADYLYFVSRNDGTHAFSSSLEEHNRNVQKYQVQYFRDRR